MPLSKARNRERMRLIRLHAREVQPKVIPVQPNVILVQPKVIPELPWYAGAGNHFGVIRNEHYARQFFSSLGQD